MSNPPVAGTSVAAQRPAVWARPGKQIATSCLELVVQSVCPQVSRPLVNPKAAAGKSQSLAPSPPHRNTGTSLGRMFSWVYIRVRVVSIRRPKTSTPVSRPAVLGRHAYYYSAQLLPRYGRDKENGATRDGV